MSEWPETHSFNYWLRADKIFNYHHQEQCHEDAFRRVFDEPIHPAPLGITWHCWERAQDQNVTPASPASDIHISVYIFVEAAESSSIIHSICCCWFNSKTSPSTPPCHCHAQSHRVASCYYGFLGCGQEPSDNRCQRPRPSHTGSFNWRKYLFSSRTLTHSSW